jgi:broad-specificity NMP kinase
MINDYLSPYINKLDAEFKNKPNIRKTLSDIKLDLEICYKANDSKLLDLKKEDTVKYWNTYLYESIIKKYVDKKVNVHNVTVYTLKINEQVEEIEVPNPDYQAYIHKKEMFDQIINKHPETAGNATDTKSDEHPENDANKSDTDKKKKRSHIHHSGADFMIGMGLHNVPPQTIKKKNIKYVVSSNKEGTVLKRLDTLYLRKTDSIRLHTILKNFSEHTNIYEDLCISKKLGIMLYGVPGTGKSSAIMAIATHLNYDIYYVSLNGVNKNSQLKLIFDFVAKNCSKRGLMVFEDIDAQTNVVHKRTIVVQKECKEGYDTQIISESLDESDLSVHSMDSKKNDDLDLSFFLNMLDGTLSQQDMVYVMTTNHLERLDPALYRKGRIHAMIHLKKCDQYQISCIFEKIFKKQIDSEVLAKIPEDVYTPAEVIQHFLENIHNIDMSDQEIIDGMAESQSEYNEKSAMIEANIRKGLISGVQGIISNTVSKSMHVDVETSADTETGIKDDTKPKKITTCKPPIKKEKKAVSDSDSD